MPMATASSPYTTACSPQSIALAGALILQIASGWMLVSILAQNIRLLYLKQHQY